MHGNKNVRRNREKKVLGKTSGAEIPSLTDCDNCLCLDSSSGRDQLKVPQHSREAPSFKTTSIGRGYSANLEPSSWEKVHGQLSPPVGLQMCFVWTKANSPITFGFSWGQRSWIHLIKPDWQWRSTCAVILVAHIQMVAFDGGLCSAPSHFGGHSPAVWDREICQKSLFFFLHISLWRPLPSQPHLALFTTQRLQLKNITDLWAWEFSFQHMHFKVTLELQQLI